ncbi:MAG: hypothetical protein COW47_00490 [Candidatus Huberarchaeum crystalense]|uniref:Uncharacterized protein n=1 Tax=Huberarchaeum crystalense TaxID=2014257 RepID=A0A2H9M2F0_HUBC1|nr:hypothetical protein [archaeon]OIP20455.1 MAG: hypothetical protein AUJ91_01230 [archaeon CG2_30_31_98]PIV13806.1 MAG: hypothetical protein COS45_01025 [Candidatus Huberarchaeum crystalense]PIV46348.1 MAG: hypothetical protein COS22_01850 [Candidatus Huberarchaeum crystalense]PIV89843.1 MAG: hypothetical protein COW47_00490 [Candidatus Huberarchaeum crystalense]
MGDEAKEAKLRNAAIIGAAIVVIFLYLISSINFSDLRGKNWGGGSGDVGRKIITPYESMPLGEIMFSKTQEYSQNLGKAQISPSAYDVILYENNKTQNISQKNLFLGRGTDSIAFSFLVQDYDAYFVGASQQILLQFTITSAGNKPLIIKLNNKEIFNDKLPVGLQVIQFDKKAIQLNNKIEITTVANLWETTEYTVKNIKLFSHDYTQNIVTKSYKPSDNKFKAGKLKFDVIDVKPNQPAKLEIKHNGEGIFYNDVVPIAPYSTRLFTNIYPESSNTLFFYVIPPFKINISNIRIIYWDGKFVTKELSFNIPKLKKEKQLRIVFFVNETLATLPHEPIFVDLTTRTGETQKGTMINPAPGPNYLYFQLPADFTEGTAHLTFSTESSKPYNITKVQPYIL